MKARGKLFGFGLFFMSVGAVCNGPAIAQSLVEPVNPPAPVEVFSSDEDVLPQGQNVKVGVYGQIDLHVKDLDLTKVLQLLSIQSEKNIIASRNVAGAISADLYGVDFYEALAAILHPNGFGFQEEGQFIYVYTADELKEVLEEDRETVHEVVRLSYVSSSDAATFITPLLSSVGSVAVSTDAKGGFQPSISDGGANSFAHTDTLMITDYPENVDQVLAVLKEIDVRPKQVLIEATILQTRLTEANAFGVDFAVFNDLNLLDFTTPLGAFDELLSGTLKKDSGSTVVSSPGNTGAGRGSLKFGVVGDDVAMFIRALDEVADTNVIASPRMLVLNRQKAHLLVGEELGYISTNATETSTTQTVEFLEVGTSLDVRAFIGEDDFVRLELNPSISDGSTQLVGGFVIPNTTTSDLITNVMVKSGETVVLGGLFKEDTAVSRTQVPGAGDIPILGAAFKGQDDAVTRSEVIFLIKPTVMRDKYLSDMGDAAMEDVEMSRIGFRDGLLPWSRTKLVTWQMREANKYHDAGDMGKAKWHANLAIYLDPTAMEARKMREEITREKEYNHNFSLLKNSVDAAVDQQMIEDATEADEVEAETAVEAVPAAETEEVAQVEESVEVEGVAEITEPVAVETQTEVSADADWQTETAQSEDINDEPDFSDLPAENDAETAEADASEGDEFFAETDDAVETESDDASTDEAQTNVFDVVDAWLPGEPAEGESVEQVSEVETPAE